MGGEEEEPAYIIDDAPVFHVRRNTPQNEPDFDRVKAFKWGEFTHPSLMMGMPDAPGMIKVYVSKVDDYYAMHLSAATFFMASAKSENKPHECHKYSCTRDNLPHDRTTFQFNLCASAVKKKLKKKKHLELPNYISLVLKKNTAFTYNKRVSSGSSEKHVQQAIQEIFGEPPSPRHSISGG